MKRMEFIVIGILSGVLTTGVCAAQEPVIYPANGQNAELMEKDKYECYTWAKEQSSFDPMQQPKASATATQQEAPKGGLVRGAARGALVGVTVGAIAGDAGKGAGIGAAAGGLGGGLRRVDQQRQQQHVQHQQEATVASKREGYNRANSACLEGRGYSVK